MHAVPDPATAPVRQRSGSSGSAAGTAASAAAAGQQQGAGGTEGGPSGAPAPGSQREDSGWRPPPRGSLAELRQEAAAETERLRAELEQQRRRRDADEAGPADAGLADQ